MTIPVLGLPKFPNELDYHYSFTEELDHDVLVSPFQSGLSSRSARTSHRRRTFNVKFTTVKESTMKILQQFYNEIGGPLKPFLFEPPIEKFDRYTQLLSDGSQQLADFEDGSLRAGNQSVVVRFTRPFSKTLFKPLLETTGLVLTETLGEDNKGKYIHFDGLLEDQYAVITDLEQDFLDLGTDDFMIDFLLRGETVFISTSASYASLSTKTLIFTIDSTPYTVTFTASATDAASVVQEINDQQGDYVKAQVFGTTQLKIVTNAVDGFFTVSGTAFAQLDLDAPNFNPINKRLPSDIGYYFQQPNVSSFLFYMETSTSNKTITADSSFHLLDGSWHYIAIVCDRDGNGQMYIDGVASGVAVDISAANLTLDNTEDFFINKFINQDFDIDRVGIWSWDAGSLPADIVTRIATMHSDWFRIDNEDGLDVLYTFDDSTGDDSKQQEDLTLIDNPAFVDFIVQA